MCVCVCVFRKGMRYFIDSCREDISILCVCGGGGGGGGGGGFIAHEGMSA